MFGPFDPKIKIWSRQYTTSFKVNASPPPSNYLIGKLYGMGTV